MDKETMIALMAAVLYRDPSLYGSNRAKAARAEAIETAEAIWQDVISENR